MRRLLCVEDSPTVTKILEATLRGHEVNFASTIHDAIRLLQSETFDLLLLDLELPDGNGIDLYASLPERNKNAATIFLTGNKDFSAKAAAFALGAEDYIQKPFDPKELKLRVDAKLAKATRLEQEAKIFNFGQTTVNVLEQRVYTTRGTEKISVDFTKLEFKVLSLLAKTPNKIFQRSEIVERVWGPSHLISERAVDVHVSNVRKKLSDSDLDIESVFGSGYRLKTKLVKVS